MYIGIKINKIKYIFLFGVYKINLNFFFKKNIVTPTKKIKKIAIKFILKKK
jgi:hypothetical protein